ncbi:halocin C8 precursor-like protein [Halobacillus massiliensis]|uniref:halocin C8 precursor-like protein n=1 Tax=Halobacillus massiliensis TaxID=1926286 RepID=UPI0009E62BFD|nr:halocin C8 precursor-like protein [Halobacillus massiliensis]
MKRCLFKPASLLIVVLALIISSFHFSTMVYAHSDEFTASMESNVSQKEFNQIRNDLKHTTAYKKYKEKSKINSISQHNIVINKVEGAGGDYAYIEFVFNKNQAANSDNLVYAQFTYDLKNKQVITDQGLFAESLGTDGSFNMNVMYGLGDDEVELYNVDVDKDGNLTDIDGLSITQEQVQTDASGKIKDLLGKQANGDELKSLGFCEYAVTALCGAGGSVGCYALAGALGITSGIGGVALAAVCGMIGSLGCAAATDAICG